MPQDSILGPMLLNLFINNLPSAVKSSCTDSYVDDTKIYCSFSAKNMNSCFVKMTEDWTSYCRVVLLTPITDKSKQNQTHFFRDKATPKQGIRHQSTFARPRTHSGILS